MPPQSPATAQPVQQTSQQDLFTVTNIDTNCDYVEQYIVERTAPAPVNPGEVNPLDIPRPLQTQRMELSFDHSEYYEVRYESQPFRIVPGGSRVMPRYVAEHYAKHLADHILTKMEDAERAAAAIERRSPKVGFVQSATLRPQILSQILTIESYFLQPGQPAPMAPAGPDMPGAPTHDLGTVPNYAMGELKPQPKTADEILGAQNTAPVPESNVVQSQPMAETAPTVRSREDLVKEAISLGIDVNGSETEDDLRTKIRAFAG